MCCVDAEAWVTCRAHLYPSNIACASMISAVAVAAISGCVSMVTAIATQSTTEPPAERSRMDHC